MAQPNLLAQALKQANLSYRPEEFPNTGLHCSLTIEPEQLRPLARSLASYEFFIETVTALDLIQENRFEAIYLFNHYEQPLRLLVRIPIPRDRAVIPSIGTIFPGAVWHERETAEMFGLSFQGCPDSRNLLLPEDATFHPLRKDFSGAP